MIWHAQPLAAVEATLEADARSGVSESEAKTRLARSGPNLLQVEKKEPWWEELIESLLEPLQLLLLGVGIAYFIVTVHA